MFQQFQGRVGQNPNDAEALWGLSICYLNGWHGAPENKGVARTYLERAARAGSQDAINELAQEAARDKAGTDQVQRDQRQQQQALDMFSTKAALLESIRKEIFPALVLVKTITGGTGSGFFQHSEWLVSNAHIIPSRGVLENVSICDVEARSMPIDVTESYHRPSERNDSPDLVIVKVNSRMQQNGKCLPTDFTGDRGTHERYFFYIDCHSTAGYQVKFLKLRSKPSQYPIVYEMENGEVPQPGSSGSPIIEARVVFEGEIKWQFRVASVLYARCLASWYNDQVTSENRVSPDLKLVCAIPAVQDFGKILSVLYSRSKAERAGQMAFAANLFKDKAGREAKEKYVQMAQEASSREASDFKAFEAGESSLDIALPDGLEKLWYSGIVRIEKSLLIGAVLKEALGSKAKNFSRIVPDVSLEALQEDFSNLMRDLSAEKEVKISSGDNFRASIYFRIDVQPVLHDKKKFWMLQVQDNTGFDSRGRPLRSDEKSLSSVFSVVKVDQGLSLVGGKDLANAFKSSEQSSQAHVIHADPPSLFPAPKASRSYVHVRKTILAAPQTVASSSAGTSVVQPPIAHPKFKTVICKFFQKGDCEKGERCTYIHAEHHSNSKLQKI